MRAGLYPFLHDERSAGGRDGDDDVTVGHGLLQICDSLKRYIRRVNGKVVFEYIADPGRKGGGTLCAARVGYPDLLKRGEDLEQGGYLETRLIFPSPR